MNRPYVASSPHVSGASAIALSLGLVLFAIFLLTPISAFAAIDMFLQIDGVEGSVKDIRHPGAMSVVAFTDVTKRNRDQFQLIVTKTVDKGSTALRQMQSSGSIAGSATLTIYTPGPKVGSFETVEIEMSGISVRSVITAGTSTDETLNEIVTLNFASGTWAYTPLGAGGTPGGKVIVGYDLTNNRQQ